MPGLTIGWEYLTGYAVATDPGNRQRAEWPPHPARVFMALAAAWFETGEDDTEGDALRWLETLDQPQLVLPPRERVVERSHVTVYVPVNDRAGPSAATLQSAPAMTRSKQPRAFPRVHIGDASCYLHWPTAEGVDDHHEALDRLCGKVTRIGHSSSFVRMWAAEETQRTDARGEHLVPDDKLAEHQARSIAPGMLKMLVGRFGEAARQKHAEMTDQVDALKGSKKAVKGKGSKERERKAGIDAKIRAVEEQLVRIVPRPPIRPTIGLWTGYRRVVDTAAKLDLARSHFDTDLLVLTRVDGPRLPVVSSLVLTCALRGAVMKHSGIQPVPAWVSGHEPDGSKCENDAGHLACIPLPFVGHDHADGHLLGVGLVFPRSVDRRQRGRVLGPLLVEEQTGEPCDVKLHLGRLGVSTLRKRAWSEMRDALQPEVWTAHPNGATTWASVTPVVAGSNASPVSTPFRSSCAKARSFRSDRSGATSGTVAPVS